MAIEIVDFPINSMVIFHSYVSHYQRVGGRHHRLEDLEGLNSLEWGTLLDPQKKALATFYFGVGLYESTWIYMIYVYIYTHSGSSGNKHVFEQRSSETINLRSTGTKQFQCPKKEKRGDFNHLWKIAKGSVAGQALHALYSGTCHPPFPRINTWAPPFVIVWVESPVTLPVTYQNGAASKSE